MGIVRIRHDSAVEIIDPGTPEEEVAARAALHRIAAALARLAARRDSEP